MTYERKIKLTRNELMRLLEVVLRSVGKLAEADVVESVDVWQDVVLTVEREIE